MNKEIASDARIKGAKDLIHRSYNKRLFLKDVARECQLGRSRFCQLFKAETGLTFKKYIREMRLGEAKKLLSNSSLEIKQIVYEVGYKSPQSFSNDFRKRFSASPSQYRKEKRDKNSL